MKPEVTALPGFEDVDFSKIEKKENQCQTFHQVMNLNT